MKKLHRQLLSLYHQDSINGLGMSVHGVHFWIWV